MKHLLGEASEAEQKAVAEWLHTAEPNRQYYEQLKKIWDNSKELAAASPVDANDAWVKFQQRTAGKDNRAKAKPANRFVLYKIAAAIILAAGLLLVPYYMNKRTTPVRLITSATNTIITDTLPDGSVVTLNKKSSVSYPRKFNGNSRPVTLTGEAFFSVTPNKQKPFIISVNDISVTVVGTSFNIRNTNEQTEVVVETGVVKITRHGKTVELKAGEKILFTPADTLPAKETMQDKLYNYYRSKEFVCDNTPLWKLAEVLNEAYGTRIVIGRKELNDLRLNTTFNNESLDKILEVIHLTFDITITRQDGQIILN